MSSMDGTLANISMASLNDDSSSGGFMRSGGGGGGNSSAKKHHQQLFMLPNHQQRNFVQDERDKTSFYRDLYHFHETKGTPIPRLPRVNGHEIDLHKFYSIVCGRGGWAKINYRNEWEELVTEFGLSAQCVNASVALKQIYIRYLDRYEKIHFLGEDNDRNAEENDDDMRHKKWSSKNFNEVPLKYNHHQHIVTDSMRALHKLSTDLYRSSEYDRLLLSLMSPLPNEQDFAINVCTLMANESKHTLKIEHCPKLLDALLGHAGIYSHFSMREIFSEFYSKVRKHSLQSFWTECLQEKPEILEMAFEDYFQSSNDLLDENGKPPIRLRPPDDEMLEDGLNVRRHEVDDFTETDFLNLKRGLGTHDYIGQRIHQITTICRNLSFFDENVPTLVHNRTFIRYLVMCANIRWGNLHQMGLDMLGNVAIELDLSDPNSDDLTRCLLTTIADGLESPDRGVIISCMEILYKLCQRGTNDDFLHRCLNKKIYRQICLYLSLNDIMLLLYTLECLFALSSLGEKSCYAIVQIHGVIDTLVSLVSVEAQSYGPDGCILMRVVETVPTHLSGSHGGHGHQSHQQTTTTITTLQSSPQSNQPQSTPAAVQAQTTIDTSMPSPTPVTTKIPVGQFSPRDPPKPLTPTQVHPAPNVVTPNSVVTSNAPSVSQPTQITQTPAVYVSTPSTPVVSSVASTPVGSFSPTATLSAPFTGTNYVYSEQQTPSLPSPNSAVATPQQQVNQENEQFALAWLRATFEPASVLTSRIEQQDLYKMYVTACSKVGRTGVVSTYQFPRSVRNVFGTTVGPNTIKIKHNNSETTSTYYEGIRIRAHPLAVVHKGTILQAAVTTTSSSSSTMVKPAMIHQSVASGASTVTATSAPILQQVLSSQASGENVVVISQNRPNIIQVNPTASPQPSTPSSLIKSLLANKVNADGSPIGPASGSAVVASPSNSLTVAPTVNVQVAQRQHLQKQKEAQQLAAAAAAKAHNNIVVTKTTAMPTLVERKLIDEVKPNWDPVPPLAPLSSGIVHSNIRPNSIMTALPSINSPRIDEDSNSTNQSATSSICGTNPTTPNCNEDAESSFAGFEGMLIPGGSMKVYSGDESNDANKQSPVVSNNKMLADLLERKSTDPPFNNPASENATKRKIDFNDPNGEPATKRTSTDTVVIDDDDDEDDDSNGAKRNTSSNAANAYAQLAASLMEDEDMELDDTINNAPQPPAIVEPAKPVMTIPMQRQIIVTQNNQQQMVLAPTHQNQPMGQATATIKTESGYQTVPVILQHNNPAPVAGNIQFPKQIIHQQQPTQYVLATNQQGQHYLLAQQPQPPPVNQILLTQSPQQQGGQPTRTIVILQQPAPNVQGVSTPHKMIMTTQQGQPMIYARVPQPIQHHVIVNSHATGNVIQSAPVISTAGATQPHIVSQIQLQPSQGQMTMTSSAPQISQPMIQVTKQGNTILVQGEKKIVADKKVFVTNNGNIEVTEVQQPQQSMPQQQIQQQRQHIVTTQQAPPQSISSTPSGPTNNPIVHVATARPQMHTTAASTNPTVPSPSIVSAPTTVATPPPPPAPKVDDDAEWPFVCDWRGCPRRKFRSAHEVYMHACAIHIPDSIDSNAEIYCQWGAGPNLCDNLPRKRFSLMTHMNDRHCTLDSLKASVQRRLAAGPQPNQPTQPNTIIKNPSMAATETASPAPSPATSSTGSLSVASSSAAMQAIKRHALDLINPKDLMAKDENEGPVTKSIRLTAALILRNLVNYTTTARRCLRYYEPHLSGIALSNVESSRTIAQVLFEMNETPRPY